MDIYERIKADHDHAREVMEKIKETSDQAKKSRKALFDDFKRDMWVHHKLEEAVFYSVLLKHKETKDESFEALNEHHAANGMIEELDTMPVDNPQWTAKFGALSEMIEHHMDEEEEDTFKEAAEVLSEEQADEIGQQFDDRKKVIMAALEPVDLAIAG